MKFQQTRRACPFATFFVHVKADQTLDEEVWQVRVVERESMEAAEKGESVTWVGYTASLRLVSWMSLFLLVT